MFVQATKSKRGNKIYISYLVREAFRTPKGPRSRTVCNISGLPADLRDLITAALAGKPCAALESLELESALNYGGLAVLRHAWHRFGLERVLEAIPDARQRALLQAMIFGRVLGPSSKGALAEQAEGTLMAAACALDPAAVEGVHGLIELVFIEGFGRRVQSAGGRQQGAFGLFG